MAPRPPRDDSGVPPSGSARPPRTPPPPAPRRPAHPGQDNYPPDPPGRLRRRDAASGAYLPPRTHNPHLPPLEAAETEVFDADAETRPAGDDDRDDGFVPPEKVTVVRVMATRSKYLAGRGVSMVHRAATADGADRSGLTALTMPVVLNSAVDAAMAVALANTLFFAAATGDSKVNVGLYLLLTIAPFAVIAPLIGPLLDRLQHGRRISMAVTFGLRAVLALLIIVNSSWDPVSHQLQYKPWILYPCALGLLVLSKSFGVLKSAVAPRVLPPSIDLVRVNSRLTMFGLIFGTVVAGGLAALVELVFGSLLPFHLPGAMAFLCLLAIAGAYFCMKIPSWVEVTEGEVPTTITYRDDIAQAAAADRRRGARALSAKLASSIRQPLGRAVVTGLWGNGTIRILTGFLTIYVAFYAREQGTGDAMDQLLMLGAVGAGAGVGNAAGNAVGTRLELSRPPRIIVMCAIAATVAAALAAIFGSLAMVIVAAVVASGVSAVSKVCLDSTIQDGLPEASRASAFGRSETVLQLCWVLGASLGVVLPTTLWIGFTVIAALMAFGLAQTVLTSRGSTLIPGIGGRRPTDPAPTSPLTVVEPTRRTEAAEPETARADAPSSRRPRRPPRTGTTGTRPLPTSQSPANPPRRPRHR
ncbi:MAG: MFS transporter [Gordonia sp. (in: high G+C Gram-positive bacteria)]|uniref:MFS transporter n=1 Tax=Gordonia sp. (in: high G+C Gram-positive bacteria) TaxID=84139 RepID=UPI0039E39335